MQYLNTNLTPWHITFGTYGARLHGGRRPTVDRNHNELGTPFLPVDEQRERQARNRMISDRRILKRPQRAFIEDQLPSFCDRGGWEYRVCAAESDHVHLLCDVAPHTHGKLVRRLVKRWLSQELSEHWPQVQGARWWAIGGSTKAIHSQDYLNNVYNYIIPQRVTPLQICET